MANSPARAAIDVGTVIAGTYTIEAMIGRGGMGAVFLASHARLPGKQVAIKVLHADLDQDDILARFRREAEIASRLGHPNIVIVHDSNTLPDGTPYLVLEYLEGENLAQRIARGPIALADTLTIVRQIASALAAAHGEGIIHRDLKPQNVFLVPTEVGGAVVEQVKVLDFGISKIRGSQTVKTQDSAMLGTPQYMSPEQATGKHAETDERTDLFALGSMVYEMLCGQPAFTGASVPEVVFKVVYEEPTPLLERVPELDRAVAAAVQRAIAKKPDDRFRTVTEFVEALTGRPVSLLRPPKAKASGGTAGVDTGGKTMSQEAALANTVGSGDHGAPPAAVADTLASGDHRDSRVTLGTSSGVDAAAAPTTPTVTPPVAPPSRRNAILAVGAVAAIAVGFLVFQLTRSDDRRVVAAPIDAAMVARTPVDAATAPAADAPVVVVAAVDAAPGPDAPGVVVLPDARERVVKRKPDAAETEVAANPETDRIYARGVKLLIKDTQRTRELGNRLKDRYQDPRGWVLIGAVACQQNDRAFFNQAKAQLKNNPKLTGTLFALCRNNLPR
jgi:tRNA A-37 threonylcarbamoyl transferase component Bud32